MLGIWVAMAAVPRRTSDDSNDASTAKVSLHASSRDRSLGVDIEREPDETGAATVLAHSIDISPFRTRKSDDGATWGVNCTEATETRVLYATCTVITEIPVGPKRPATKAVEPKRELL